MDTSFSHHSVRVLRFIMTSAELGFLGYFLCCLVVLDIVFLALFYRLYSYVMWLRSITLLSYGMVGLVVFYSYFVLVV